MLRLLFLEAIEATFTGAELCANDSALETLAIFLLAATFLAVAALVVETDFALDLGLEGVRVAAHD